MAFLGGNNNIFEGGGGDDPERFFSLEITEGTPRTLTTHDQIAVVEARIHSIFSALKNGISLSDPQGQLANLIAEKARLTGILIGTPQQKAQSPKQTHTLQ